MSFSSTRSLNHTLRHAHGLGLYSILVNQMNVTKLTHGCDPKQKQDSGLGRASASAEGGRRQLIRESGEGLDQVSRADRRTGGGCCSSRPTGSSHCQSACPSQRERGRTSSDWQEPPKRLARLVKNLTSNSARWVKSPDFRQWGSIVTMICDAGHTRECDASPNLFKSPVGEG